MRQSVVNSVTTAGVIVDEAERERLRRTSLVISTAIMGTLAWVWGAVYVVYGETTAGLIPLVYAALSYLGLLIYWAWGHYHLLRDSQLLFSLLLPFALMVTLGGFVNSSAVILWSLTCPIGATFFANQRQSFYWSIAFLVLVVAGGLIEPIIFHVNGLPDWLIIAFFVLNIVGVSITVLMLLNYFVRQRDLALSLLRVEQVKSESLLLNVLPASIAALLKEETQTIVDRFDSVSVLFADIVGYTTLSETVDPVLMVEMLNDIYSHWDSVMQKYGLEKIRTMGDAYMAAAGVPTPRPDHAHAMADAALEMMALMAQWESPFHDDVRFRMGINSGPVTAGIIGHQKFSYDVWGDPVNVASRMESHGEPGRIQISRTTYELLKDDFNCVPRGPIAVKGKGEMETWFLLGRAESNRDKDVHSTI